MNSIADGSVMIQTSSQSVPSTPGWMGEVVLLTRYLRQQGVLEAISEQVRFARRRFGRVRGDRLCGGALRLRHQRRADVGSLLRTPASLRHSGSLALFGRERLPARSTLSRFLAALSAEPVEALRKLFLADLVARQLSKEEQAGGLWDRQGRQWMVFDGDGTREAARQRARPQTSDRPP